MKAIKKLTANKNFTTFAIVVGAYAVMEILMAAGLVTSHIKGLLVPLCVYAILAVSLNLTVGILGQLSLGHAGFMCVGAFASAFFSKITENVITLGWLRFLLAIVIGFVCAGIVGFLVGLPVLRLKGDYLAIVTLAFGEIIKNIINVMYVGIDSKGLHFSMKDSLSLNMEESGKIIINGAQGITGTPKDSNFTIGVILLLVTLAIVLNLMHSRDGRAVMSIRDNEIAAESVGINITRYKLSAFAISAAFAGLGGVLYAHNLNTLMATPKSFGYNMSIMILVFVVLGGIGSMKGSVIAAVLLTLIPELLRGLSNYRMLIYSLVLIIMMILNWAPAAETFKARVKAKLPSFKKKVKEEA